MRAHLPEAVAAFFKNGGRRCFVVRVAGGDAASARLRVPGLVGLDSAGNAQLASLRAASPGTWATGLRLASRLRSTPLPVDAFTLQGDGSLLWLTGSAPQAIQVGDLLRLIFDDGQMWLFPVTAQAASSDPAAATTVTLATSRAYQVRTALAAPLAVDAVARLTLDGTEALVFDEGELASDANGLALRLTGAGSTPTAVGDVLRLALAGGEVVLFPVSQTQALDDVGSPPQPQD